MEGDPLLIGIVSLLLVFGSFFFVAAEYALISARRSRIEAMARKGNRSAKTVLRVLDDVAPYIAATQIGITMIGIAVGSITEPYVTRMLERLFGSGIERWISFAISFIAVTFVLVVLGELVPKYLALRAADRLSLVTVKPLIWIVFPLRPLIWLVQTAAGLVLRLFGMDIGKERGAALPRDELLLLVRTGGVEGVLDKMHAELVSRALRLDQLTAEDIMIHRLDIRWIDIDTPRKELFLRLAELPHTRLPVCRGDIDEVVGIIYLHDVIKHCEDVNFSLEKITREATVVPENLSIDKIISRMREAKTQMLIVVDEYGGTSGLVTLEDVVEEVFGELEDHIEGERPAIDILASGRISCKASVRFDELLEKLEIELAEEPSTDTLATLIVEALGRVPKPGDHIDSSIGILVVENMARRRITRVSVHLSKEYQAPPPQ